MARLDDQTFRRYMVQAGRFEDALRKYDPNTWFPPPPGKPTKAANQFVPWVPPSWGRWKAGNKYGVHFTFRYAPEWGTRLERIELSIGVESPMKRTFTQRFKQSVIDAVDQASVSQSGFVLAAEGRGKLLKVDPIPFSNESWRIALDRYVDLQPVVRAVSVVLREYEKIGAFEVPVFSMRV